MSGRVQPDEIQPIDRKWIHSDVSSRCSLSTDSLASRGVCRHKHRLVIVNTQDGLTLEWVQNKRVLLQDKQDRSKQKRNRRNVSKPTKYEKTCWIKALKINFPHNWMNIYAKLIPCVKDKIWGTLYLGRFPHSRSQWFMLITGRQGNLKGKDFPIKD